MLKEPTQAKRNTPTTATIRFFANGREHRVDAFVFIAANDNTPPEPPALPQALRVAA